MSVAKYFLILAISLSVPLSAFAKGKVAPKPDLKFYRDLTLKIRPSGEFRVPMVGGDQVFDYKLEMGAPVYKEPDYFDSHIDMDHPEWFFRSFWDRIMLKDGSHIVLNGEEIPLTCIVVSGQDNRWAGGQDPRLPQFVIKITFVANDFSCVGPLNPGWPSNGGKKEAWDTYLHYTVKDPTIMLPMDAMIRYRWNEFQAYLLK